MKIIVIHPSSHNNLARPLCPPTTLNIHLDAWLSSFFFPLRSAVFRARSSASFSDLCALTGGQYVLCPFFQKGYTSVKNISFSVVPHFAATEKSLFIKGKSHYGGALYQQAAKKMRPPAGRAAHRHYFKIICCRIRFASMGVVLFFISSFMIFLNSHVILCSCFNALSLSLNVLGF